MNELQLNDGLDVMRFLRDIILKPVDETQMPQLCTYLRELFDEKNKYKGENAYEKQEGKIHNAIEHITVFNGMLLERLNEKGKMNKIIQSADTKVTASFNKDITQLKQDAEELQALLHRLKTAMREYWEGRFRARADAGFLNTYEERIVTTTIKQMELATKKMDASHEKFAKTTLEILKTADSLLGRLTSKTNEMSKNKLYLDYIYSESMRMIKEQWENQVKNKTSWLYHGTSALFLPNIKKNGLDNKKLTKGVKRAIEGISKAINKYGGKKSGPALDVFEEMSQKKVSLAPWLSGGSICDSACAASLPSFLYELLNKEYVLQYWPQIIEQMTPEERKMCEVAWRFGKILRAKNKIVLLHIKFGSEYLKLVGFPDYFSDFDVFYSLIKRSIPKDFLPETENPLWWKEIYYRNSILLDTMGRKIEDLEDGTVRVLPDLVMLYYGEASPAMIFGVGFALFGPRELWIDNVPTSFIFLKAKTPDGVQLINIKEWDTNTDIVFE